MGSNAGLLRWSCSAIWLTCAKNISSGPCRSIALISKAKAPDIEREVLFLQELLNMTRNLPVQLFDGEQGRMKVIDAVQESVDAAIRREDEYLASLGDA